MKHDPKTKTSTVDLNRSRMSLRPGIVFVPQRHRGTTYYHVESRADSKFFRIGYAEYVFVSLLDGETTFAEALALTAQAMGPSSLSTEQAKRSYLWLLENQLGTIDASGANRSPAATRRRGVNSFFKSLNPFWLKLPLGNPDGVIKALLPVFGWLFSPPATAAGVLLVLAAVAAILFEWNRFLAASATVFSRTNWLWLLGTWTALKLVHETAHGIACRYYGCRVKESGIVLILFAPLAYIDVTPSWRLPSKWQRIHIAAAGIYLELVLAALASFVWLQTDSELLAHLLFNLIVMASISTVVFNANPLMRFDGYFVMSDLLEIPNLYTEGLHAVRRMARRFFFGQSPAGPRQLGRQTWLIAVYGWCCAAWRVVICISLALAASVLFKGAGVALAMFGILSWFGLPIFNLTKELVQQFQTRSACFFRSVGISSALVAVLSLTLCYLPTPMAVSAPGIVEYRDVDHLRTLVPGFIDRVLVRDGDLVEQGQILMVLDNRDVTNTYRDLQIRIQQTKLRYRIALDEQRIADSQVEQQNLFSFNEQLVEATRRYLALEVRAGSSGRVVHRTLDRMIGQYVEEGDVLLSIGNEAEKELIVSVAQADLDNMLPAVGKKVRIRDGSLAAVEGILTRLEPRASTDVTHPALAATEGGPLAVVEVSDKGDTDQNQPRVQLSEPRFRGVVTIPPGDSPSLFSGQCCRMTVSTPRDRLGLWLWNVIRAKLVTDRKD